MANDGDTLSLTLVPRDMLKEEEEYEGHRHPPGRGREGGAADDRPGPERHNWNKLQAARSLSYPTLLQKIKLFRLDRRGPNPAKDLKSRIRQTSLIPCSRTVSRLASILQELLNCQQNPDSGPGSSDCVAGDRAINYIIDRNLRDCPTRCGNGRNGTWAALASHRRGTSKEPLGLASVRPWTSRQPSTGLGGRDVARESWHDRGSIFLVEAYLRRFA